MHTDQQLLAMWREGRRIDAVRIFRAERNAPLQQAQLALKALDEAADQPYPMPAEPLSAMTLRDHFAGLAMQGVLSDPSFDPAPDRAAVISYMMADAMLAARKAPQA